MCDARLGNDDHSDGRKSSDREGAHKDTGEHPGNGGEEHEDTDGSSACAKDQEEKEPPGLTTGQRSPERPPCNNTQPLRACSKADDKKGCVEIPQVQLDQKRERPACGENER